MHEVQVEGEVEVEVEVVVQVQDLVPILCVGGIPEVSPHRLGDQVGPAPGAGVGMVV